MLRIATRFDPAGPVTLSLFGSVSEDCLGDLERALEEVRGRTPILIDLGEVTLVDRQSLRFLAAQARQKIKLVNCPEYIEPWISRELGDGRAK